MRDDTSPACGMMRLNNILIVVITSGAAAAIWTLIIGVVWFLVAAFTNQMSRYWPVVLGTLRGAFLSGSLVGIIYTPSSLEASLGIGLTYSMLGALGGAVWGYYGLTRRLRSLLARNVTAASEAIAADRPSRRSSLSPRIVQPPDVPLPPNVNPASASPPDPSPEPPANEPPVNDRPTSPLPTPIERARQGDSQAIAELLSRQLDPHHITVQVVRQGHKLRIGLRRESGLNAGTVVNFLQQGLERLSPQGIQQVEVIGQVGAGTTQVWRRSFTLASAAAANADEGSPKPSPKRWVGPVNTYQPPRDPRKFVLEIAAKRYEVPAIAVWAIAIGTFLLDMSVFLEIGTFFADAGIDVDVFIFLLTGLLAVLVRPALALIPAVFAQRRGRPFLPWFLYGYIFFLVTLIFVLLLKPVEKPDFSQQDLRQVSFARQSLRQVNFQGANVAGVDFSQADLAAANFKQANCTGTRFNRASIRGTCFDQATLSQATFVRARQGTAAIAINRTFSSIPPLLWGLIIVFVAIPTLAGGLLFAIGPLFRILLLIGLGYTVMSLGITWVVIKLTHLNREAAPLIWGGGVGLAIVVRLSATPMTPTMPGLIVISLGLAAIAQVSLLINRWHLYGAAIGALSTLCFTEVWAVLFQLYVMPVGLRWVFAVLGALIGCLIGAGIQQGLPSFRAARLINTDFSYADLKLADFRETEMQQATFYRAQLPGAFRPTGRRQWLANLAICLSEQITAYLQRFRT